MKHKRLTLIGGLLVALLGIFAPLQTTRAMDLFTGERHLYTVQMRSDGKALTYAKLIFINTDKKDDQATYELSLPEGVKIQGEMSARQILATAKPTAKCAEFETFEEFYKRESEQRRYWPTSRAQEEYENEENRRCKRFEEADDDNYDEDFDFYKQAIDSDSYYKYNYYSRELSKSDEFKYANVKVEKIDGSESKYRLTLDQPIKANKQGAVLVAYASDSFTSNILGRFSYTYKTLLAKNMIDEAKVSINFDDDLYVKGSAKLSRETRPPESNGFNLSKGMSVQDSASTNSSIKDKDDSITKGGFIVKEQKQILAGETAEIKGVYATNRFMLRIGEIIKGILILLALVAIGLAMALAYRRYRKKHPRPIKSVAEKTPKAKTVSTEVDLTSEFNFAVWDLIKVSLASIFGTAIAVFIMFGMMVFVSSLTASYRAGSDGYSYGMSVPVPSVGFDLNSAYGIMFSMGFLAIILFGFVISPILYLKAKSISKHGLFIWSLIQTAVFILSIAFVVPFL